MTRRTTRRSLVRLRAAGLAGLVALVLAACGSEDGPREVPIADIASPATASADEQEEVIVSGQPFPLGEFGFILQDSANAAIVVQATPEQIEEATSAGNIIRMAGRVRRLNDDQTTEIANLLAAAGEQPPAFRDALAAARRNRGSEYLQYVGLR